MSEKPEKQFEQLMKNQGMEQLRKPTREQFEELMKKNELDKVARKEGHVFVVSGRDEDKREFKPLAEFETIEEARDWYNSLGQLIVEEGGEIRMHYGPPELPPQGYYIVRYHEPSLPEGKSFIYQQFDTKEERDEWYVKTGREIVRIHGGFMEMPSEPLSEEEIKKQKSGQ